MDDQKWETFADAIVKYVLRQVARWLGKDINGAASAEGLLLVTIIAVGLLMGVTRNDAALVRELVDATLKDVGSTCEIPN